MEPCKQEQVLLQGCHMQNNTSKFKYSALLLPVTNATD